jgi:hypothetical protein
VASRYGGGASTETPGNRYGGGAPAETPSGRYGAAPSQGYGAQPASRYGQQSAMASGVEQDSKTQSEWQSGQGEGYGGGSQGYGSYPDRELTQEEQEGISSPFSIMPFTYFPPLLFKLVKGVS